MASYHRVLDVFGRSDRRKTVECDCDIHPWDILIDGKRWSGKVRLIGFVDVFFLISYSGESRFEHGLVIYKDDDAVRSMLKAANVEAADIGLTAVNQDKAGEPPRYFSFESEKGGLDYTMTSLGHPIGLKTNYPRSSLERHTIKIRKPQSAGMKKRIRRAVTQHDMFDLMHDAVRFSIISHAELIGLVVRETVGGTVADDVLGRYLGAYSSAATGSGDVPLSGDQARG